MRNQNRSDIAADLQRQEGLEEVLAAQFFLPSERKEVSEREREGARERDRERERARERESEQEKLPSC